MPQTASKTITESSPSRAKILAALAAPERNGDQLKAKMIALLDLFPNPKEASFKVLPPEQDYIVQDWFATKEILDDAKLEVDRGKVAVLTSLEERRYLITSDRQLAIDTRRQAPSGTVAIEGPSIPETRRLAKLAEVAFSVSDLTADEFERILKIVPRERCKVSIGGFESRNAARDLLTTYEDRATFSQTEASRIAKGCKVPAFVAK